MFTLLYVRTVLNAAYIYFVVCDSRSLFFSVKLYQHIAHAPQKFFYNAIFERLKLKFATKWLLLLFVPTNMPLTCICLTLLHFISVSQLKIQSTSQINQYQIASEESLLKYRDLTRSVLKVVNTMREQYNAKATIKQRTT